MMQPSFQRIVTSLLLVLLAGCGSAASEQPATIPVRGTVQYQGKPLTTGTVMFYPESGDRPATGMIGADGAFTLTTFEPDDGAVAGPHKVAVQAFSGGDVGTGAATSSSIPVKYAAAETTPLRVEVAPGQAPVTLTLAD